MGEEELEFISSEEEDPNQVAEYGGFGEESEIEVDQIDHMKN